MLSCTWESAAPVPVQRQPTPVPTLAKMAMPTLSARPAFVQATWPEEYTVVPLALYYYTPEGIVGHGIGSLKNGFQSSICVRPFLEPLIQAMCRSTPGILKLSNERYRPAAPGLISETHTIRIYCTIRRNDEIVTTSLPPGNYRRLSSHEIGRIDPPPASSWCETRQDKKRS